MDKNAADEKENPFRVKEHKLNAEKTAEKSAGEATAQTDDFAGVDDVKRLDLGAFDGSDDCGAKNNDDKKGE